MTDPQQYNTQLRRGVGAVGNTDLVFLILDDAYSPNLDHATVADVVAHEVTGGSYARATVTATVSYDAEDRLWRAMQDSTPSFDLTGISNRGFVVVAFDGADDAHRNLIAYFPDPGPATSAYETFFPGGIVTDGPDSTASDLANHEADLQAHGLPSLADVPDGKVLTVIGEQIVTRSLPATTGAASIFGDPVEVPRGQLTEAPVDEDGKLTANVFVGQLRDATGDDTDAFLALPPAADQDPGTLVFLLSADGAPSWGAAEVDPTPQPAKLTNLVPVVSVLGALAGSGSVAYSYTWQVAVNGTTHTITVDDTYNTDDLDELRRLIGDVFAIPGASLNYTAWEASGYSIELHVVTTATGTGATISVVDPGSGTPDLASVLGDLVATNGTLGRITGAHDGGGAKGAEHYYTIADWTATGTGTHVNMTSAFPQSKASIIQAMPADVNGNGGAKWTTVARVPRIPELWWRIDNPEWWEDAPDEITANEALVRITQALTEGLSADGKIQTIGGSTVPWGTGGGGGGVTYVADAAALDAIGSPSTSILYGTEDTGKLWRWTGSSWTEMSPGYSSLNAVAFDVDDVLSSKSTPADNDKLLLADSEASYTGKGLTLYNFKTNYLLVGSANGLAQLDSGGKVPSAQLPSYVDDVVEVANFAALPGTGETGKIYVTLDDNKTYRWSGSAYVEISASLALGETSATAYRGDRGKTAYDHSQATGNPHGTTPTDITGATTDRILGRSTAGTGAVEELTASQVRSLTGAAAKDTDWHIANSFMSFRPTEASPGTYGSSVPIVSGAMAATKIVIRQDTTISGAKLYVRTAGSAGAKVQVGIYALSGGKPNGAPLLTTSEVDVTSTGYKNPTFSGVALSAGAYAMVWWANDTGLKMQMVDPTTPGQTWPLGIDTDTLSGPTGLGWASTYASSMPTLTASNFTLQSSTGYSPLWCPWKVS